MEDIKWGYYEQLRPAQIERIFSSIPIAYLPWGAIEYHGNHNPIGLDSMKASALCRDLASEIGGLVMPTINMAANLIKSYPGVAFPKHSIEFSESLIRQICHEYLIQLVDQDFKIIVIISGHAGMPHLEILKQVSGDFNIKYPDRYCWALAEFDILPDNLLVANHSAIGETSIQLFYNPNTVDLKTLPVDRELTLELDAVSGADPRLATRDLGKIIVNTFLEKGTIELKKLINKYV